MPKGGAHFTSEELDEVIGCYELGQIRNLKPLSAGNRRAPKMIIYTQKGTFLLKRRSPGKNDLYHVAFTHAVQTHLAEKSFLLPSIITTKNQNNTMLRLNGHIYELFEFITGTRYNGSPAETLDAGKQLAKCHLYIADFSSDFPPLKGTFHDAAVVRHKLKTTGSAKSDKKDNKLCKISDTLMRLYNQSSIRVNQLGFDNWKQQVIHADWHPGNMLFDKNKLVAVLDFDSIRIAPPVVDLANAMLQFSIVGNRPNPADWPAYLDQAKLIQLLNGYRQIIEPRKNQLLSLPDLMIETMIAEAILPVAAAGSFANLEGTPFLKMIHRKTKWMNSHRRKLLNAINA